MKKILLFSVLISSFAFISKAQNVGINTSGSSGDASSMLDVSATDKGVLIPRVALVDVSNATTPVNSPAIGLLVYNTNAAVTGGFGAGFYYWSGTWTKMATGNTLAATLTDGRVWIGNGSNVPTERVITGDATISNTGSLDLSNLAVETSEINDLAVTTAKIADNNVTTAKILDANVITNKIADANITTAKIADNAVDGTKINIASNSNGDIMYYNGTDWVRLPAGSTGQILRTTAGAAPVWVNASTVAVTSITTSDGITGGTITSTGNIALTGQALALHNLGTNGVIVRTGAGAVTTRTIGITGTGVAVTNGDGVAGNPLINLDYGNILTGGTKPVGNFGQFQSHSTYTDFNTTPNYWGWNFVQGNTNAPNATSAQWYRENISLGSEYPGRGAGGYSLELAYPRTNTAAAGIWMRTVENGVIGAWTRIDAAGLGTGTTNTVTKWTSATTIGNSTMTDDGTTLTTTDQVDITGGAGTVYTTAPIEIRTTSTPRVSFHWPGVVASQIGMDAGGVIRTFNNPGTGYEQFAASNIYANGFVSINSASDGAGNLRFTAANPHIVASSYFIAPGGAYFNSLPVYTEASLRARGGIQNDAGATLSITGGTAGTTTVTGILGVGTASTLYGANASIYANQNNQNGGGIIVSDDGGFVDYNDGPVTFVGSTGLRIAGSSGAASSNAYLRINGLSGVGNRKVYADPNGILTVATDVPGCGTNAFGGIWTVDLPNKRICISEETHASNWNTSATECRTDHFGKEMCTYLQIRTACSMGILTPIASRWLSDRTADDQAVNTNGTDCNNFDAATGTGSSFGVYCCIEYYR